MYLVVWTEKGTLDHYRLFEGESEARRQIKRLSGDDHVYCWALTRVLDASEPHWME